MESSELDGNDNDGEFLWLVSLSDLMILLFVFFVVLFSFYYKKASNTDISDLKTTLTGKGQSSLQKAEGELLAWAKKNQLLDDLQLERKDDSVILRIKEKLLFESGSSNLKKESFKLLYLIGDVLKILPSQLRIGIEGHTDNQFMKLKNSEIDGNWRLSTLRALSVLEHLGFDYEQMKRVVILGYGPNRPINKEMKLSSSANRRVSIRIY